MECKNCGKETSNLKFCSRSCSASYNNRGVIRNPLGRPENLVHKFPRGHKGFNTPESRKRATKTLRESLKKKYKKYDFNDLPRKRKLERILEEQDNRCNHCGLDNWNKKSLILELHHKDGYKDNEKRNNLEYLCPNCHSQTDFWRKPIKKNI
jgi:Zn finger protein HypA/HybF involved in hydrogenase expression